MTIHTLFLLLTAINIALLGSSAVSAWVLSQRAYVQAYRRFALGFGCFGFTFLAMALRRITALNLLLTRTTPLSLTEQFDQIGLPLAISIGVFSGVVSFGWAYSDMANTNPNDARFIGTLLFGMEVVGLLLMLIGLYTLLALSQL